METMACVEMESLPVIIKVTRNASTELSAEEKARSDGRADFMKRFFAVAVSVGFASKISDLTFLFSFTLPTHQQIQQLALLIIAMVIVVGSWEFYFNSINKRPLVDFSRFVIDIIIVSMYIVLLLSIGNIDAFLIHIVFIMFLYVLWDIFSMRAYPHQYGIGEFGAGNVARVYLTGLRNWSGVDVDGKIGPFITLWWSCVFVILFVFYWYHRNLVHAVPFVCAVAYILYRRDQSTHWRSMTRCLWSVTLFTILFVVDWLGRCPRT